MKNEELEAIRKKFGLTQELMAELLQCSYIAYKRYATGARIIPKYIARSVRALDYIRNKKLLKDFENSLP